MSYADYMLGHMLNYYAQMNLEGKISEVEMENRMDKARNMSEEQLQKAYSRMCRARRKQQEKK